MRKNKSLFVSMILLVSSIIAVDNAIGCQDYPGVCQPQCVKWARQNSDIQICGYAKDWPNLAGQKGYKLTDKPKEGRVIVLDESDLGGEGRTYGHVIAVLSSKKKDDGKYSLKITHSNFNGDCRTETVKATYYKKDKKIKFKEGAWANGKKYKVKAIIKKG